MGSRQLISSTALALGVSLLVAAEPYASGWETVTSDDPMTGNRHAIAQSPTTSPTPDTTEILNDVSTQLVYVCDEEGQQETKIRFERRPSITDVQSSSTREMFEVRIRWDDEPFTYQRMSHEWLAKDAFFEPYTGTPLYPKQGEAGLTFLDRLQRHQQLLVEIDIYPVGYTLLRYSLDGSSAAISKARDVCGAWLD